MPRSLLRLEPKSGRKDRRFYTKSSRISAVTALGFIFFLFFFFFTHRCFPAQTEALEVDFDRLASCSNRQRI
ncbi:hypothetical protein F0562_025362 [Nyssa sinensis]|uniref:Uncharacterized protein n=1 Tax=Nyssa sinensis TaxID=561372 RepID=A0A5J5BFB4_9ASTE|nr:hypothetical protein F0562_025362 [Nyssa sinensis]